MTSPRCEFEFDGYIVTRCEAPARFTITRADGDKTYGIDGECHACPAHVPELLFDMASGDEVGLVVSLHYDQEVTPGETA